MDLRDYIQTDGSDNTLQYGRKLSETSWEYMEWVDQPLETPKDTEFKLANLEHTNWRRDTIDLEHYTKEQIEDAISTFGYSIEFWTSNEVFNINQSGFTFSVEDSVQLSCECIFELEL